MKVCGSYRKTMYNFSVTALEDINNAIVEYGNGSFDNFSPGYDVSEPNFCFRTGACRSRSLWLDFCPVGIL